MMRVTIASAIPRRRNSGATYTLRYATVLGVARPVRTYPATIFFVTCASIVLAFIFLALVRIPRAPLGDAEDVNVLPEGTGLYADGEAEGEGPVIVVEDAGRPAASSSA